MADLYNMNIDAGIDYGVTFTYKDATGNPVDLTNFTARMQFRRTIDNDTIEKEMTTESGHLVITALTGVIDLAIPNDETTALSGVYFYDLELVSAANVVTRLVQGKVIISGEVTR